MTNNQKSESWPPEVDLGWNPWQEYLNGHPGGLGGPGACFSQLDLDYVIFDWSFLPSPAQEASDRLDELGPPGTYPHLLMSNPQVTNITRDLFAA